MSGTREETIRRKSGNKERTRKRYESTSMGKEERKHLKEGKKTGWRENRKRDKI